MTLLSDVGDEDEEEEGELDIGFEADKSRGGDDELLDDNELNEDMKPLSVIGVVCLTWSRD
jgi:hypothetical protein